MKYFSNAEWPKDCFSMDSCSNITKVQHLTYDEAFFECCELEYKGNPVLEGVFPNKTWVSDEEGNVL